MEEALRPVVCLRSTVRSLAKLDPSPPEDDSDEMFARVTSLAAARADLGRLFWAALSPLAPVVNGTEQEVCVLL